MTPADFGYVKCFRCGCWRPKAGVEAKGFGATTEGLGCLDGCEPSKEPSHLDAPKPKFVAHGESPEVVP